MAHYMYHITLGVSGHRSETVTGIAGEIIRAAFEGEPTILIYQIGAGWTGKADGTPPLYPLMGLTITFIQTTDTGVNKADLDQKAINITNSLQAALPSQPITLIAHAIEVLL